MSNIDLKAFPENLFEALAMLYVQNQDLKGKKPEDICGMYWNAYYRIRHCNAEMRDAARSQIDK